MYRWERIDTESNRRSVLCSWWPPPPCVFLFINLTVKQSPILFFVFFKYGATSLDFSFSSSDGIFDYVDMTSILIINSITSLYSERSCFRLAFFPRSFCFLFYRKPTLFRLMTAAPGSAQQEERQYTMKMMKTCWSMKKNKFHCMSF